MDLLVWDMNLKWMIVIHCPVKMELHALMKLILSHVANCVNGYTGNSCEIDIDDCSYIECMWQLWDTLESFAVTLSHEPDI